MFYTAITEVSVPNDTQTAPQEIDRTQMASAIVSIIS